MKKNGEKKTSLRCLVGFPTWAKKTVLKLAAGFRLLDPPFWASNFSPKKGLFLVGFLGPNFRPLEDLNW